MATTATPYGARPVNLIGGQFYAGGTRQLKIASGYNTNIFFGDFVKLVVGGTIEKDTGTTAMTTCGVFLGVSYIDPSLGYYVNRQWWSAGTTPAAGDAMAIIADDPDLIFQIQASATLGQNAIGTNAAVVQNAGSTAMGDSRVTVNAGSIADTATLPIRIIDFVPGEVGAAYPDLLVKINTHAYNTLLGNAAT